jgi:hypothetical protein
MIPLALFPPLRWNGFAGLAGGYQMLQPRESAPLWVWLALGLMAVGSVVYVITYFMIEDVLALVK